MLCTLAIWPAVFALSQAAPLVNVPIDDEHSDFQTGHLVTHNQHWRAVSAAPADGYYFNRGLVFSKGDLTHVPHHVLIPARSTQSQGAKGPSRAYALFDYANYTRAPDHGHNTLDARAPARRSASVGGDRLQSNPTLTICASAGGAALLIVSAAWYLFRRWQQRRARSVAAVPDSSIALTPYPIPSSPSRAPRPAAPKIRFWKPSRPVSRAPAASAEAPHASVTVERLQAELERVLEENEILRQAAEPPPGYSDGARSEHA